MINAKIGALACLFAFSAACAAEPGTGDETVAKTTAAAKKFARVRKDAKLLSKQEKKELVNAILKLKKVASPYNPSVSYYDQFVVWHRMLYACDPMMTEHAQMAHGGSMFLPWHREYILLFENALRDVGHKDITLPYWDWTDPESTAAVFSDELMGGSGDPSDNFVVHAGPFRAGEWRINVNPTWIPWVFSASENLVRAMGTAPFLGVMPTAADVQFALSRPSYDVHPYDVTSDINLSFRNAIEGWVNALPMTCQPDPGGGANWMANFGPGTGSMNHNAVHGYIGGIAGMSPNGPVFGTMMLPTSPNDPIFWLHHSNIDRIWAKWQETHGVNTYEPVSGHHPNNVDNTIGVFDTAGINVTPADMADISQLGYSYE